MQRVTTALQRDTLGRDIDWQIGTRPFVECDRALVQRILQKHAGAIWAEAELDKGACSYFTVGAVPATAQP